LFQRFGAGHEQFAWDIRSEPALIDAFAKIWNTDELLVSFGQSSSPNFDPSLSSHLSLLPPLLSLLLVLVPSWLFECVQIGELLLIWLDAVNVSLPYPKEELGDADKPWAHVDQSPNRRFKHCVQGIMNLVSKRSFRLPLDPSIPTTCIPELAVLSLDANWPKALLYSCFRTIWRTAALANNLLVRERTRRRRSHGARKLATPVLGIRSRPRTRGSGRRMGVERLVPLHALPAAVVL
jgi:hypothetical protein